MKKILFLACSLTVIFACSTENETEFNQNQNQPTEKTAARTYSASEVDEMFSEYVNSIEYINLKNANIAFNLKMGSLSTPASLSNESEFLSWIELNINQTDFVNMGQVHSDWNNIKELNSEIYTKFPQVTDFIVSGPDELVISKLKQWTVTSPTSSSDCPCCDDYNECSETAIWFYQSTMMASNNAISEDGRVFFKAVAERNYQEALAVCWANLQACPLD